MKLSVLYNAHRGKLIALAIVLIAGGIYVYRQRSATAEPTRYVLAAAENGTLVVSVSGTGQVATTNQVTVQPQVSGQVVRLSAKKGQSVKAGDVLLQLDSQAAQKSVRDAETSLESAKLALEKLTSPPDDLTVIQAENSLAQAREAKVSAEQSLVRAYESAFTTTANAFLDLPGLMGGFDSLLYNRALDQAQWNVDWYANVAYTWEPGVRTDKQNVISSYEKARSAYDAAFQNFKGVSRTSPNEIIAQLVNDSYQAALVIADAVKSTNNYLDHIQDLMEQNDYTMPSLMNTHQNTMDNYTTTVNSHVTALAAARDSIINSQQSLASAERSIVERQASLNNLKAGADALDLKSQQLSVKQREDALQDAREKLADYTLRAPFNGVITDVTAQVGQYASGSSTSVTVMTAQKLAEVSLNEVDVASVAVQQKATLTFDAIDGLTISGQVAEVDEVGTVSQGVVSYSATIAFDTQDERVKPGMSVSAAIATNVLTDVLTVPNAAIKTSATGSYVETLNNVPEGSAAESTGITSPTAPERQAVEIGIASDAMTQIISGLKPGDMVVIRTVAPSAAAAQSTQSIIPLPGTRSTGSGQRFNIQR